MARLTHALDEIYSDMLERLDTARADSAEDFDMDAFILHVEDRFGEYVADRYWDYWYAENV